MGTITRKIDINIDFTSGPNMSLPPKRKTWENWNHDFRKQKIITNNKSNTSTILQNRKLQLCRNSTELKIFQ